MPDREKVINELVEHIESALDVDSDFIYCVRTDLLQYTVALLKEQEKKEIKLHKKHVITWKRDDKFTMKKLYEAICETLLDEGELFIARIDDHEKVDFTFYVTK